MKVSVQPGVRLNVRHRDGAGRPYLLVHGLSSNARLWDELASHLPNPSYAVDLRSHGESDAPEHGYDTATAAADLATLITELGLDRPVAVGQSWGGNVVVRLAAKHPDLVSGLGLVDGGWIDLAANFGTFQECERALRPSEIDGLPASKLREWMAQGHPDWSSAAVEATLANMRVRDDGTIERRLPIDRHMAIVRSMWDEPPAPFLPLITAPALLLPAVGPDGPKGERIAAAAAVMQRARIVWYPNGDHDLHAQHPARLAADLLTLAG
ncbi:MAG TPA: alpha/beta hydrolase [Micromonosporaceae bacterium]|nr:alpha/beta hydrolase [Micromonosporaceae bacterium]